jgi:hypothetical protein
MRKIKNFKSYNESLSSLLGYNLLQKKYDRIDREELSDRLLEITDLGVDISEIITKISDKSGKEIVEKSNDYCLSYYFTLSYDTDIFTKKTVYINSALFTKKISKLSTVSDTIESVFKKISKIYNLTITSSIIFTSELKIIFKIVCTSNELLPNSDFDKLLKNYGNTIEGKCYIALSKIKKYFTEKTGIKNPSIDFNWDMIDDVDHIYCGYFDDDGDDISLIACYYPKTNKIEYDDSNIDDLID